MTDSSKTNIIQDGFFSIASKEDIIEVSKAYSSLEEDDHVAHRTNASRSHFRDFRDIDTNVSVRSPFAREDYEFFRGNEALPSSQKEEIRWAMRAYKNNGIVQNIIDLMSDFISQGARLVHPNKANQKFFDWWWEKVSGKDRTERIANLLYRAGTVVVRRKTGKIKNLRRKFVIAQPDEQEIKVDNLPEFERSEIPVGYILHNPLTLDVVGDKLASFVGKTFYSILLPKDLVAQVRKIRLGGDKYELELVNSLPAQIRDALLNDKSKITLDPNKTESLFYKKDDWCVWGRPMVSGIIKDLILLEKMKLADMTALDGIISSVRLWRLGSLEHKIMPAPGVIRKLTNILVKNVAGGSYDLVWDAAIDFKESDSKAYQSLGKEKYEPTLNAIYAGLGIPPTLTGSATQSGMTNNFISLKTLTERLEYGRDVISRFWKKEIAIVQKSLGLKVPATLVFDHIDLQDNTSQLALLLQMWDRNIISNQAIIERLKEHPELERIRIKDEDRMRNSGKMTTKVGPFNADKDHDYKKIFAQNGEVNPDQLGLDIEPSDDTPAKRKEKMELQKISLRPKGQPQQGRPRLSNDKTKRKQRIPKPRQSVTALNNMMTTISWAKDAYEKIERIVNPAILKMFNKKKMVSLTNNELTIADNVKFNTLMSLSPFEDFNNKRIGELLKAGKSISNSRGVLTEVVGAMKDSLGRALTADDLRTAKCYVYSIFYGE